MVAYVRIVVFLSAELCVLPISLAVAGMDQQNSQRNHLRDLHCFTDNCHSAVITPRVAQWLIPDLLRAPKSTTDAASLMEALVTEALSLLQPRTAVSSQSRHHAALSRDNSQQSSSRDIGLPDIGLPDIGLRDTIFSV